MAWWRPIRLGGKLVLLLALVLAAPAAADSRAQWEVLNAQAVEAYQRGDVKAAVSLAKQALGLARSVFGPKDPHTLASLNNLASALEGDGRYADAEPLFREALDLCRQVLGPKDPQTLTSMNNLAMVLQDQGRYVEAESLYRENS